MVNHHISKWSPFGWLCPGLHRIWCCTVLHRSEGNVFPMWSNAILSVSAQKRHGGQALVFTQDSSSMSSGITRCTPKMKHDSLG